MSGGLRALLCWSMASHLNSLWLFPEAFLVLISSKLYVVTRGALVPEMARTDQFREHAANVGESGWPTQDEVEEQGFSGFNAQLTLLGTFVGLFAGSIGAALLKGVGASSVLITASIVFVMATIASIRLQRPAKIIRDQVVSLTQAERDLNTLNPTGDVEVAWGLTASALMRFSVGFTTFMLAFGLRREHAGLTWFACALAISGVGALLGLAIVTRVRNSLKESTLLTWSLLLTGAGAGVASAHPQLLSQILLAGWFGLCAAVAQPSFDAITQRNVPSGAQGRTFARFAVRQQLLWVIGALIPVAITLNFKIGDRLLSILMIASGFIYGLGRRFARR